MGPEVQILWLIFSISTRNTLISTKTWVQDNRCELPARFRRHNLVVEEYMIDWCIDSWGTPGGINHEKGKGSRDLDI